MKLLRHYKIKEDLYLVEQTIPQEKTESAKTLTTNHIWVYDRSYSMSYDLKQLAKDIIEKSKHVPRGDTISLGWFSGEGDFNFILKGFKITSDSDYSILTKAVENYKSPVSCTCFSEILADTKNVISTVIWNQNLQRIGQVQFFTYFTNWEESVTAQEADCLTINTSGASIAGKGEKELLGLIVQNTCGLNIILSTITPTWNNTSLIEEIKIDGTKVWRHNNEGSPDGKQSSGIEIDIVDFVLSANTTYNIDKFKFDGNMEGVTFSIVFTMSDGSSKTVDNFSL